MTDTSAEFLPARERRGGRIGWLMRALTGDPMVQPPVPPGSAFSRLDAIRARMQQRNPPPGQ